MASYSRGLFDQSSSYQGGFNEETGADVAKFIQVIGSNIQKISQNVAHLQKLVGQIGTPQDSEELRDRVHQIIHSSNELAKETNKNMQTFVHLPSPRNLQQQKQIKVQKERITEQFSDTLKNFQTIQRTAAERERQSITRARAASNRTGTVLGFGDEISDEQFQKSGFSPTAQILKMEHDVDFQMIKERESAIVQLEKDIMDVNQIFKDLGMLLHEQGEVIDSIEANVESVEMHVEQGSQQLIKANDYQSKARRKKCCLIVVLLIILAIVAIIIAVTLSK